MANSPSDGDPQVDAELVVGFIHGNEAAFEQIFYRYSALVFAVAMRSLGDRDQAEEVVENVFSQAATNLARLREPGKLRPWLLAVTSSEVSHLLRSLGRERRRRERVAGLRDGQTVDPNSDEAGYAAEVLDLARKSLSPDDQVLLGLVLAETPSAQLADVLGVDVGAANTRKSRLYDRLRSTIEVYWIARPRPGRCSELETLLAGRPEHGLSRSTCRAIERHSRQCERCRDERRRVEPLALLGLAPLPAFEARDAWKLLGPASRRADPRRGWRRDGFPNWRATAVVRPLALVAAGLVVIAVAGTALGFRLGVQPTAGRKPAPPAAVSPPPTIAGAAASSIVSSTSTSTSPTTTATTTTTVGAAAISTTSTVAATTTKLPAPPTTKPAPQVVATTTTTSPRRPKRRPPPHQPPPPAPPMLIVDSGPIDLGQATTSASVSFHASTGAVTWSATAADPWLSVSPSSGSLAPGGEGSITVSLDRTSAPAGPLTSTVSITSSDGQATVTMQALELAAPTLSSFGASPNPVSCAGQTTATVTVAAPAGVQSATVSYSQAGGSIQSAPMSASGANYSAVITPTSCRALPIQWSVTVVDGDGKTASGTGPAIQVLA